MRTETKSGDLRTKTLRVGLALTILMAICCAALSFRFLGNPRINLIEAKGFYQGGKLHVDSTLGSFDFPAEDIRTEEEIPEGKEFDVKLGIRPEMIELEREFTGHPNTIETEVYASQPAGSETIISLTVGDTEFLALSLGLIEYEIGEKVFATLFPERINVYNKETGRLIKVAHTAHRN